MKKASLVLKQASRDDARHEHLPQLPRRRRRRRARARARHVRRPAHLARRGRPRRDLGGGRAPPPATSCGARPRCSASPRCSHASAAAFSALKLARRRLPRRARRPGAARRRARRRASPGGRSERPRRAPRAAAFRRGLASDLLNVKVGLFWTALVPQFVSADSSALLPPAMVARDGLDGLRLADGLRATAPPASARRCAGGAAPERSTGPSARCSWRSAAGSRSRATERLA